VSPSDTAWPSSTTISFTVPSSSASTGISIFIDSRITSVSPSVTSSPTWHSTFQTVPVMWASTFGNCDLLYRGFGRVRARYPAVTSEIVVVVSAYNEEERLGETLAALRSAFPGARVMVADDFSADRTGAVASEAGAEVVRPHKHLGKGGANTLAVQRLMSRGAPASLPVLVLCDGDLGSSAAALPALVSAVRDGDGDLAVGAFVRRVGGGFGIALRFSRWAIRRRAGVVVESPISGQRALAPDVIRAVVPFADGFGMETAMTIDAVRAGFRVVEVELPLSHRATGKTLGGFVHRFRQLLSFARVYVSRR
jgi:glycosyltransferase involved in cell wall biosynthesis